MSKVSAVVAALALGAALTGCAATTNTAAVAVDYNRVFARSRDEVLVTNILRAAAREPLQFSTMGTVTGGVRNTGAVKLPIPSLIGAGATILSPEFTVNEGINPSVNIIPLSNKEFTEGILKPVSLDAINYFINQGWDAEFILPLVVEGVVCGDGSLVLNRGAPATSPDGKPTGSHYDGFIRMFAQVPRLPIRSKGPAETVATVRLPGKEAAALIKDGPGKGRKLGKIAAVLDSNGRKTGELDVEILSEPGLVLTGLQTDYVCTEKGGADVRPAITENAAFVSIGNGGKAMLRSVEGIIYFLGETHRKRWSGRGCAPPAADKWPNFKRVRDGETEELILFQLSRACVGEAAPLHTFLRTRFNDGVYFIRRAEDGDRDDRTLTTLSFLNELIALQTSESSITAATPIVAIGGR